MADDDDDVAMREADAPTTNTMARAQVRSLSLASAPGAQRVGARFCTPRARASSFVRANLVRIVCTGLAAPARMYVLFGCNIRDQLR